MVPSLAGPKRPQDRVALADAKTAFREALGSYVRLDRLDDEIAGTFPASDPFVPDREDGDDAPGTREPKADATVGRPSTPVKVTLDDGTRTSVDHGSVVIAAITSCTNTSNPSVMVGAALLARNAVEAGLARKPWVKTTLAPGSKVVMDYYERAGLLPYLEKLGFNLVGYGCTTCIGNSGPLPEAISTAVADNDLAVVAVLSGNRNFEGRINPDVKMNYLASPPLVVAYALAGTMDIDMPNDPLGSRPDGTPVYLRDIWPAPADVAAVVRDAVAAEMFTRDYADVFEGDDRWRALPVPSGDTFAWDADSTYVRRPPYFEDMADKPAPVTDIHGARVLAMLGDSVTTDHISPAGAIKADSPAGRYLTEHGVERRDFNSYGSRRGNHEVMIRGTFANIRLRNQLAPGTEGGVTVKLPEGAQMSIYDASRQYLAEGTPLLVLGGQGVRLRLVAGLGGQGHASARRAGGAGRVVRADPPLEPDRHGGAAAPVPPRGVGGLARVERPRGIRRDRYRGGQLRIAAAGGDRACGRARIPRRGPDRHARGGRILPARRDHAVRAALAAGPGLSRCVAHSGHRGRPARPARVRVRPGQAVA